jgi:putative glutamate/gamma-aminobutyrate antiporter
MSAIAAPNSSPAVARTGANAGLPAEGAKASGGKKAVVISMVTFAIMNIITIISLRGLPSMAEYGLSSVFYYVFAAIVFFVPVSLVAAELASAFPKQGGVFRWVGEAFGPTWGFAAIYYQWQAIVIWFPTVLIFSSAALAYMWWPQSFDTALAGNKLYVVAVLLAVYWGVTIYSFRGIGASSRLSSLGGLIGTIIPGIILILLAAAYVAMGHPVHLNMHKSVFPDIGNFQNIVLAAGVFLFYAGMEIQAVHVRHLKNPARDFPLAVLIATVVVVILFVLGTLAVSIAVPRRGMDINQGLLVAYRDLWTAFGASWLGNIMAAMVAIGVLGQVSVLVAGPSTGILAVGKAGHLPPMLQRTNANDIPVPILIVQGVMVTILSIVLIALPSVQSAYQLLTQMATIIYLIMYVIMYAAAIRLRYTQPDADRAFRVPGGNVGMWLVGIVGLAGALIGIAFSCIPPNQFNTGSPVTYVSILIAGTAVFVAIPFVVSMFHNPNWKVKESDFEPFEWEAKKSRAAVGRN